MVCPKCHSENTKVYNSRPAIRTNQTWRRRRCQQCGFAFSTREYIEADQYLKVIHSSTKQEPFSRTRLLLSLANACQHYTQKPDVAFHLLATVETKLLEKSKERFVSVEDIVATTLKVLQRFDTRAYLSYLAAYPTIQDSRDLKKILKN